MPSRDVTWVLQSTASADSEFTFRLPPGAVRTVGRARRADFIVDAALVSRLHCRLTASAEQLEVEDLSSTNGTYVNDKRIARARLTSGDRLRVGRVELRVERGGETRH
jgi:pSer/pThr/pTyr-binding forkhead associated (FHA) protein